MHDDNTQNGNRSFYKRVMKDLRARVVWEDRQRLYYEMRHNGLRRLNKPYPSAADLHFPLADTQIDKLKPFFYGQVFATEEVAEFITLGDDPTLNEVRATVQEWFNFTVKQRSNFETEILACIDNMLMSGKGLLKVFYNHDKNVIEVDAIDPLFLVVPSCTGKLSDADRVTHIQQMSVDAYQRNEVYNQDPEVIKQITGKPDTDSEAYNKIREKYDREGLTYGAEEDQIVLWEIYTRYRVGGKDRWKVCTVCPSAPSLNIRDPFVLTAGDGALPFMEFNYEVKDRGYYASRGIPERIAMFEMYLSKVWNEKSDAMTFFNRPLFTMNGPHANLNNIRLAPGQILPQGLQAVRAGNPPLSFDEEMLQTRFTAEQLIGLPDLGAQGQAFGGEARTATEIQTIATLTGQSIDLRARTFRLALGECYRLMYRLMLENDSEVISKFATKRVKVPESDVLTDAYIIKPNGSSDSWNKGVRFQKALNRYQLLIANPLVDTMELTKSVIEEDDPRLVKRLMTTPDQKQADQSEEQALEISIMQLGHPARVKDSDDHAVHAMTTAQYLQKEAVNGNQNAQFAQLLVQHLQQHLLALKEQDPKAARQVQQAIAQMAQQVQQSQQAQQQPPQAGPQNVI